MDEFAHDQLFGRFNNIPTKRILTEMPIQYHFNSKQPSIAQSNAENFYRANIRTHKNVQKNDQEVIIEDSEVDIIRSLYEFNIIERAGVVEFHIWDNDRPDVIIQTDYRIPEEPQPISREKHHQHDDTKRWLEGLRSDRKTDQKKVLQAISHYPNDFPESVDTLVPTLIDALKDPILTQDAKQAIENIANQRPQAVQSYLDRLGFIQENDNSLISRQASEIIEQLKETEISKHACPAQKKVQTKTELRKAPEDVEKKDVDRYGDQESPDKSSGDVYDFTETVSEAVTSLGDQTANSKSLREKAKEDAVKKTPEKTATTTYQTTQYTRSNRIKEYVKDRANGVCEGCGELAPFTSKTGEPYLHAHHVHELGKGGSDTPETVIALCPNCHYRVHHGEDGEEFNQELIERLAVIENISVESIRSKTG